MSLRLRLGPAGEFLTLAASLLDYGAQAVWAIDPINGNDLGPGTLAAPLRTMAEFNTRMLGNVISVAMSLFLVGDVVDEALTLIGVRVKAGASLTVFGTTTTTATATISVVTVLSTGGNFSYQLTTTGITWSAADVGKRLVLPGGQVSWVGEFVDANNVICGTFTASNGVATTPTATQALTVQTLSQILPPDINAIASLQATTAVTIRDVAWTTSAANGVPANVGLFTTYFGCKCTWDGAQSLLFVNQVNFRACFMTVTGAQALIVRGFYNEAGCTHVSATVGQLFQGANCSIGSAFFTAYPLIVSSCGFVTGSGAHFRNTANPLQIHQRSLWQNVNLGLSGTVGITGSGIVVKASGGLVFTSGANAKPTLSALSNGGVDVTIGTTTRTYAQIPYVDLQANAAPNTVTTLVGTPAFMVQE